MANNGSRTALVVARGNQMPGQEIARTLADDGYSVILVGDASAPTVAEGVTKTSLAFAMGDPGVSEQVIGAFVATLEHVDVLVLADRFAVADAPIDALSTNDWDAVVQENLTDPFLFIRACAPKMQARNWGRIISLVPEQTRGAADGIAPHLLAGRAGIVGLARILAHELGPDGITVNSIACPFLDPASGSVRRVTPAVPDDAAVAQAVRFLAADESSFITGKTLDVNGGWTMQ